MSHSRGRASFKLIPANPVEDVEPPKVEGGPFTVWSREQQAALLAAASGTDLHVPLYLALATGLRRGELLGLAWPNVKLDAGHLHVVQTVEQTAAGVRVKPQPKTRRGRRTVALTPATVALLRQRRVAQAEEHLRHGLGKPDLLFPRWAASPAAFGMSFKALARRLGIVTSIHDARHTHITDLLAAGLHAKIVAERVGHSNVAYLIERYGHVTPAMNTAAVELIAAALPGVG
jgi:integrase